ncbi:noroxomaritidine synthase [Brachypodium distachyon]|uniref:Cytochrome P450 n=1 Tax=Brachypodium distachyon TaxID=15368 RepID=I1I1Y8_BRADI|nr:noroxomaritidine synthase [Brachypodium distachyon]KQJ95595.1 hypothetical protein BRADI_3g17997v3 [Brachypodium distachyon]|eukprot:XP_003573557.1 noroxomaritidine synthase [Brachypodium distachyon]
MAFLFLPGQLISTLALLLLVLALYIIKCSRPKDPLQPTNWPIIGGLPFIVHNLHGLHDHVTDVLASSGYSFKVTIASMGTLVTCDPANVRHIFTSNHANYPKGEGFADIFDVVNGSLFTVDGESCLRQRATSNRALSSPGFVAFTTNYCCDKVGKGLLPFLTRVARTGNPLDINDLMGRLVFDLYATSVFGVDPGLLSLDMPSVHLAAMDTVMEVGFFRTIVPAFCWKSMRRLNIGPERKLASAQAVLRNFAMEMIERRKTSGAHIAPQEQATASSVDILSNFIHDLDYNNDDLLQATLILHMIAGRDTIGTTLPWIFYNLAKNPHVVSKIRNELAPIVSRKQTTIANDPMTFEPEEVKALVYLQASLLETLRLYPPIPFERKEVAASDVMPSGHEVCARDIIIVSLYSMGRMEDVWGADCREYKPERWFLKDGAMLRHVPSHKFLAFNSGPRLCLGKNIAITQMKTIVASVVWSFDMEVLGAQVIVEPKLSCLLQMKNGLKVKVKKREI